MNHDEDSADSSAAVAETRIIITLTAPEAEVRMAETRQRLNATSSRLVAPRGYGRV